MSSNYIATIGLEVHAELKTKSKMFCGCKNDPHDNIPNSNVCPVCLAHPGTLPVPNEEAIAKVLLFGEAVNSKVANYSEFDRKNYFYPDIPKAYQISQYAYPFLIGGSVCGVELTRVHLEEDTARSQHDHDGVSLIDFNRAGVPLMELVTEPVIHDSNLAGKFARELQLILQTINISNAQMNKGEMRVEANISVSKTEDLGTKVEVKNLNSFRSVELAIDYEIKRQITLIENNDTVKQETRGWDEVKLRTYSQRTKESAKDYRYFPDPDIVKMKIAEYPYFFKSRLSDILPELPHNKRLKYKDIGIPSKQIEILISTPELDKIFSKMLVESNEVDSSNIIKLAANYLTSDVLSILNDDLKIEFSSENFYKLMSMIDEGLINSRVAKDLLQELFKSDFNPRQEAESRGLLQSSNPDDILPIISEIISEFPDIISEYRSGKENSLQFLIGQGMKKTKGTANPNLLADLLRRELSK
ncbi:MAG: Asp-tRNA(Asn)/Glu-tRNA(Gln) amidotransferase subunit GatB [Candidatus Paceibacterota bacterium]